MRLNVAQASSVRGSRASVGRLEARRPRAKMAVLPQIHLGVSRFCIGEPNAEADEPYGFSGAGKCFR